MLQKELNATRQETEEEVGSIFMTSGCNLNCKAVLHVVAPDWDNGAGSSWQVEKVLSSPFHFIKLVNLLAWYRSVVLTQSEFISKGDIWPVTTATGS